MPETEAVRRERDIYPPRLNFWKLSPVECDVLTMLAQGLHAQTIADNLGINRKTVHTYCDRAKFKMEVDTTIRVVVLWDRFDRAYWKIKCEAADKSLS